MLFQPMPPCRPVFWVSTRMLLVVLACCLLPIDTVEARPSKATVSKVAKKKHKVSVAAIAKPSKRALSFGAPRTMVAEVQPQEAGERGLRGVASFYGKGFQGRKSASGERFDYRKMTAASNRFSLGTWLAVRRLDNGLCVVVKVNDRMHPKHRVRIIDLSRGAAERIKMISAGLALVQAVPLSGRPEGDDETTCLAAFAPKPVAPEAAPEAEKIETPIGLATPPRTNATGFHVLPPPEPAVKDRGAPPEAPRESPYPFSP